MATARTGAPRKYTPDQLRDALDIYFKRRSCTVPVLDDDGQPQISDAGDPITRTYYPVPVTVEELCGVLGINPSTWAAYCHNPEYPTEDAQRRLREYLVGEMLTRKGQDVRGPQFILQACYGYATAERREIDLGPTAARVATAALSVDDRERILREIAEEFGGDAD